MTIWYMSQPKAAHCKEGQLTKSSKYNQINSSYVFDVGSAFVLVTTF